MHMNQHEKITSGNRPSEAERSRFPGKSNNKEKKQENEQKEQDIGNLFVEFLKIISLIRNNPSYKQIIEDDDSNLRRNNFETFDSKHDQ